MCIVFFYVDNDPSPDGYQVIAAVNRDEYYKRPTQPADLWNDHCIAGLDLEPGREGGTWFGTSTTSKTGALLNILEPAPSRDKKGRGPLVRDYLTGEEDAPTYMSRIAAERHEYSGFNLVLLEKRNDTWNLYYCSSKDETTPRQMPTGVSVFGNSTCERPWQKVVHGRTKFEDIITSFNSVSKTTELKDALIRLLTDRTSFFPDVQLASQSPGKLSSTEIISARSAIYVDLAEKLQYGTRTHTLLLIDAKNRCEYVEKTIVDFSDVANPIWKTVTHDYQLNPTN